MAHKLDTLPSSSVEHDQQLVYEKQTFAQDKPFGLFWGYPFFWGGCQKNSRTVVLLMVQKSDNHHLGCIKTHVTKGTNYQPQLVCRISSINSQYKHHFRKPKTMHYRGNPSKNHHILALFYFLQMGPIQ